MGSPEEKILAQIDPNEIVQLAVTMGNIYSPTRQEGEIKCDLCGGEPQCARYCPKGALHDERAEVIDALMRERSLITFVRPLLKSMEFQRLGEDKP